MIWSRRGEKKAMGDECCNNIRKVLGGNCVILKQKIICFCLLQRIILNLRLLVFGYCLKICII